MKRLENKVAIITGGTAGIGAAAARKFAQEGAIVTVWARNAAKGQAFVEQMAKEGYKITFDSVDTSKYDDVVAATKRVFDANGKIDILINNAGITND